MPRAWMFVSRILSLLSYPGLDHASNSDSGGRRALASELRLRSVLSVLRKHRRSKNGLNHRLLSNILVVFTSRV